MVNLAQMRMALAQKEQTNVTYNNASSTIFSFKDLKPGDEVRIRFVPDKDEGNWFFWRESHRRTLTFNSVLLKDGTVLNNRVYVSVPAFNLKKNETPVYQIPDEYKFRANEDVIQEAIKGIWKEGDLQSQKLYGQFSKKIVYIFQGFVRSSSNPEPKLYRFIFNKQLFPVIKAGIEDAEFDSAPCDIEHGRDFILKVSEKSAVIDGQNQKVKDYVTGSKWSSKETPLTDAEKNFLATTGAWDLKEFIKKKPTEEQQKIMYDMYQASYNGEPYDVEKWAKDFRPDNLRFDENGNVKDMKSNFDQPKEVPTSIVERVQQVQQTYAQPMNQQPKVEGVINPMYVPQCQQPARQMLVDSPVATQDEEDYIPDFNSYETVNNTSTVGTVIPEQPKQPSAPELIASVTESINGSSKEEIAAEIMKKLGLMK